MKVLIVGLIVLALGVAGVSTYLIKSFSSQEAIAELEAEAEPERIRVLVATKSLPPGEILRADAVKWVPWPEEAMNQKYIAIEKDNEMAKKQKEVIDSIVRLAVHEGEPLLADKLFKRDKAGFMAGMLTPGMRAVSISVNVNTGVAGFILPNDRVDVLLVHDKIREVLKQKEKEKTRLENDKRKKKRDAPVQPSDQEKPETPSSVDSDPMWFLKKNLGPFIFISKTTETILSNVRVIAVNQSVVKPEGASIPAKTVTLELTPEQAEVVTAARSMGALSLTLRGIGADAPEEGPGTSTTDVEVSPLLGKFKRDYEDLSAEMARLRAEQQRQKLIDDEAVRLAGEARNAQSSSIIAPMQAAPKPARKKAVKKPVLKIYRGGAAKMEEIQTK